MTKIRDAILEHDGMIFGGFVRDTIIHNHYATLFFDNEEHDTDLYTDPTHIPETADRTLIPNDIDFFATEEQLNKLLDYFNNNGFEANIAFSRDPKLYFVNMQVNDDATLRHRRIYVRPNIKPVRNALRNMPFNMNVVHRALSNVVLPSLKLDVITSVVPKKQPFLGMPDFSCNALYLTKHGVSISDDFVDDPNCPIKKLQTTTQAIEDVISRRARFYNAASHRVSALVRNGWTVFDDFVTTVRQADYDGYCIICHDQLPEHHIKSCCCDARFHAQCLVTYVYNNVDNYACIMCKKSSFLNDRHINAFEAFSV